MASGLAVVSAADPAVVVGFRVFERRVQLDLVVVVSGVLWVWLRCGAMGDDLIDLSDAAGAEVKTADLSSYEKLGGRWNSTVWRKKRRPWIVRFSRNDLLHSALASA
jgi:hypothetical protein